MEVSKLQEALTKNLKKARTTTISTYATIKQAFANLFKSGSNSPNLNKNKNTKKIVDRKRFILSCSIIVLLLFTSVYIYLSGIAYNVKVNGVDIGKVRNRNTVTYAVQLLKEKYQEENKTQINFTSDIAYTRTRASKKELMTDSTLLEELGKNLQYKLEMYNIYANNDIVAALKTKEEAEAVLKAIKDTYLKGVDVSKLKSVDFAEKVEVKPEYGESSKLMQTEEAISFLSKGTNETKIHKIESGESFWTISRKYGMSLEDLIKANPGVNPEKINIGQTLNLVVPKPFISVKTVETVTSVEKAPFEQKIELSGSMYKDETSVKVKGEYGEKQVVADVIKVNGLETGKNILSEKMLKEPKTQVVLRGTKDPPPKKGDRHLLLSHQGQPDLKVRTEMGQEA